MKERKIVQQRIYNIYVLVTMIFCSLLLIAALFNLFGKDKEYSETENRMLAQKPKLSIANLASGKYMSEMEDYVTDQFFLRNNWISLKLQEDMLLGKRESNGVYIGKKKHLMEVLSKPDQESLDKNLKEISAFAKRHEELNMVMTLVPNAAYINKKLVPRHAPVRDQGKDIAYVKSKVGKSLNYVDLTKTMQAHNEEEIYYRTDHHWTSLGAKYAFEELSDSLGISNPAKKYKVYPVTHSFSGTLASKSGYNKVKDTIEIYVPVNENTDCVVNYVGEQKKTASMYESKALKQKDKYEVFFGGNHARIDIGTTREEKKNLLLFKDSYANCFIPFLQPYYRTITVIDPRYYYDDIEKLIKDNDITEVLFLYNVNTFVTDNSLGDVLAAEE